MSDKYYNGVHQTHAHLRDEPEEDAADDAELPEAAREVLEVGVGAVQGEGLGRAARACAKTPSVEAYPFFRSLQISNVNFHLAAFLTLLKRTVVFWIERTSSRAVTKVKLG